MELKIYLPAEVLEYFIKRYFDEQAGGCLCPECILTRALCLGVLKQQDLLAGFELKRPRGATLQ